MGKFFKRTMTCSVCGTEISEAYKSIRKLGMVLRYCKPCYDSYYSKSYVNVMDLIKKKKESGGKISITDTTKLVSEISGQPLKAEENAADTGTQSIQGKTDQSPSQEELDKKPESEKKELAAEPVNPLQEHQIQDEQKKLEKQPEKPSKVLPSHEEV